MRSIALVTAGAFEDRSTPSSSGSAWLVAHDSLTRDSNTFTRIRLRYECLPDRAICCGYDGGQGNEADGRLDSDTRILLVLGVSRRLENYKNEVHFHGQRRNRVHFDVDT